MNSQTVLDFWFKESTPEQWFEKNEAYDEMIRQRFSRYPHRNAILGRESTAEEVQFLTEPNSSF